MPSKACSSMAWATFSTCGHFTTRHSQFFDKFTAIVKPPKLAQKQGTLVLQCINVSIMRHSGFMYK